MGRVTRFTRNYIPGVKLECDFLHAHTLREDMNEPPENPTASPIYLDQLGVIHCTGLGLGQAYKLYNLLSPRYPGSATRPPTLDLIDKNCSQIHHTT